MHWRVLVGQPPSRSLGDFAAAGAGFHAAQLRFVMSVASDTQAFPPPAHTAAVRLSLLRRALRPALCDLGLEALLTHSIDRSDLGVDSTLDGLITRVSTADVLRTRTSLGRFVQGRAAGGQAPHRFRCAPEPGKSS